MNSVFWLTEHKSGDCSYSSSCMQLSTKKSVIHPLRWK